MEHGQKILFGIAAVIVLVTAWRGWRAGAVRQLVSLCALGLAYAAAFLGGGLVAPLLAPFALPERQAHFVGGALLATAIYGAIMLVSTIVFKKTAQQDVGLVRVGYGLLGALIGAVKGVVIVWLVFVVLRLVGVVAELRVEMAKHPLATRLRDRLSPEAKPVPAGPGVAALAEMKSALDQGVLGTVLDKLDPFPSAVQRVLPKMVRVFSDEHLAARMQNYPGMTALMNHPKLTELSGDPEIAKALAEQNYVALFRNAHLQRALGDPEFTAVLGKFELEKALDYALQPGGKVNGDR